MEVEKLPDFLYKRRAWDIETLHGTPTYVYNEKTMVEQAKKAKEFPAPYGLTVRYAMKANPAKDVLKIFDREGLQIDASSGPEAERAIDAGIKASHILLTSQVIPDNFIELVEAGVEFNACSLHQLRTYGSIFTGNEVSVRINPGLGSGHSNKTNVGGPASPFGIWHGYIDEVQDIAEKNDLRISRLHTHIGSGSDPKVWREVAEMSLDTIKEFPDAKTLNLGGGYKTGRMGYEPTVDLREIGKPVARAIEEFAAKEERELNLEIEPGTYLMANAGAIIAEVADIKDTGQDGYKFYILNTGLTENMRPAIYGAQHPIAIVENYSKAEEYEPVVVYGPACESGDLITPDEKDPEKLKPRLLRKAEIGDLAVIGGAGAYCETMAAHGYNSYNRAASVIIRKTGKIEPIEH